MSDRLTPFIRGFLVFAGVAMVVGAFVGLMGVEVPDKNRDAIMILIGALIARSEKIDAFFFGSSKGSEDKSAHIASMTDNTPASGKIDDPVHVTPELPEPAFGPRPGE